MRLRFHEIWQLHLIERGLRRSEPRLADMLADFARLGAGEAPSSREHTSRSGNWAAELVLALLAGATSGLLAAARWVAGLCAAVRRRLSRIMRALLVTPSVAVGLTRPIRPPGQ